MASSKIVSILKVLFLVACIVVFLFNIPLHWSWLWIAATIAEGFIVGCLPRRYSFFLLGLAFLINPAMGSSFVGLWIGAFVLADEIKYFVSDKGFKLPPQVNFGGALLVGALVASSFKTFRSDFDAELFYSLVSHDGFFSLRSFLVMNEMSWYQSVLVISKLSLALMLIKTIASGVKQIGTSSLFSGLVCGSVLSALYTVCQIFDVHELFVLNRGEFWRYVGRYSGSFSDPNAFGVMAILILPILVLVAMEGDGKKGDYKLIPRIATLSAISFFLLAFWSGSRTFILGLMIWAFLLGYKLISIKFPQRPKLVCASFLFLGLSAVALLGNPAINDSIRPLIPNKSLSRVLKTVHWEMAPDMLESRAVFYEIAVKMWQQEPLLGLGLGRFRRASAGFAKEIGIDIGAWWDNANNFYLHVMVEQGVIGLLLFLAGICFISRGAFSQPVGEKKKIILESLAIFLVLLLTGPHTEFPEVLFFLSIMIGVAAALGEKSNDNFEFSKLGVLCCIAIFATASATSAKPNLNTGFYPVEQVGKEKYAWTGKRAHLEFCKESKGVLELRALHPDISKTKPVSVLVYRSGVATPQVLQLFKSDWERIELEKGVEKLRIDVGRSWSPVDLAPKGVTADSRVLGVQIKWPDEACPLK